MALYKFRIIIIIIIWNVSNVQQCRYAGLI